MKFIFLIISISIFWVNICLTQTRITTKTGHTFIGFIQSESDIEIELLSLYNEKVVIPMSSVIEREMITLSVSKKTGLELNGSLTRIANDDFEFQTRDGIKRSIRFDEVEEFKIEDPELKRIIDRKLILSIKKSGNKSDVQIKDMITPYRANQSDSATISKTKYHKFGANLGTSAGLNIIYGYTSSKLGFHISGGYWGNFLYGFQIGPSINLEMNQDSEFNFVLAYGKIKASKYHSETFNVLLDANSNGLHFQIGFGLGSGNISSYMLLLQIGYAYRW